jgi:peptidoglycan/xylan/chitin deacetylase (PgdA/CDA1 family)
MDSGRYQTNSAIWILCYHKVGSQAEEGRRLNISPQRLQSHIRYFKRRQHRFLRAVDLLEPWPEKAVCLTFDDAYQSTIENGIPVLQSEKVTASLYAVANRVGATSLWDADLARPLASWDQLRQVQRAGFEIGNHTASHPKLANLSADQIKNEIHRAHQTLLENGIDPKTICYPYGSVNDQAEICAKKIGYGIGLGLEKRQAAAFDDRLRLPRIAVAYSDALPMLIYRLFVRPKLRR